MRKPKYNIVYLVQSAKLGGAEVGLLELLQKLNREQYEPWVLGPAREPLLNQLAKAKVKILSFEFKRLRSQNLFEGTASVSRLVLAVCKISTILKKHSIDLVHVISSLRPAIYGVSAARLARIPVIWTVSTIENNQVVNRMLTILAHKIITVSYAVANSYKVAGQLPKKIAVIYNGVDFERFNGYRGQQENPILPQSQRVVAAIGRLVPEKGQEYFVRAAKYVFERMPNVLFWIVGETEFYGDDSYYQALVKECSALGIQHRVFFTGFVEDVASVLQHVDLVVLPSVNEAFGRVLIEAMAMRKPVIGTAIGGIPEIILSGETGLLVPTRDPIALGEAILTILCNPDLARRMGMAGHQRVRSLFNLNQQIRAIDQVYQEILDFTTE